MRFAVLVNNCPVGNLASSCEGVVYRWKLIVYRHLYPSSEFSFPQSFLEGLVSLSPSTQLFHHRDREKNSVVSITLYRFLLIGGFKNADKVPEEPLHGTDIDDGVSVFPDETVYFLPFMSSGFWRISSKSVPRQRRENRLVPPYPIRCCYQVGYRMNQYMKRSPRGGTENIRNFQTVDLASTLGCISGGHMALPYHRPLHLW